MNNQPTREKLYSQSKGYGFSPALERTRKPFAVRNILTLAGLLTFTGSVCK
jgi:cytochrome c oxidase assembly factor 3